MPTLPFHIMHCNKSKKEVGWKLQKKIKNHKNNMDPLPNNHSNFDNCIEILIKIKNPWNQIISTKLQLSRLLLFSFVQIMLQIVNNLFLIDCSQQEWWRFIKEEKEKYLFWFKCICGGSNMKLEIAMGKWGNSCSHKGKVWWTCCNSRQSWSMMHVWNHCGEMEKNFNYFHGYIIFWAHQKKTCMQRQVGDHFKRFQEGFLLHVTNYPQPKLLDIKPTREGYIPFAKKSSQEFLWPTTQIHGN